MKVIFFDDRNMHPHCIPPKVGETVTVTEESTGNKDYYDVVEYPVGIDGQLQAIHKKRFIPLSEISETELAEQREQLQTV